jgi:hypothetical protein
MDRPSNPVIGPASADVPRHSLRNLIIRGLRILREQRYRAHDLPNLAISTLGNFFGDPRLLHWMQSVRGKPFDGRDVLARGIGCSRKTRSNGRAFEMDRACTAQSHAAAKLSSGHLQRIAQHPEQRRLWRHVHFSVSAIDSESYVRHKRE